MESDINHIVKDLSKITIKCPEEVIEGNLLTKEKRQSLFGNVSGGSGSIKLEEFQRNMVNKGTGIECLKTNIRINLRENVLKDLKCPNTSKDGFDYSENFDGIQTYKENKIYINFKCIVGKGGVQTRSLREVYWFIEGQLNVLKNVKNVYFVNILDGDESFYNMSKFEYLLSQDSFNEIKKNVYVGDLKGYFEWFNKTFVE